MPSIPVAQLGSSAVLEETGKGKSPLENNFKSFSSSFFQWFYWYGCCAAGKGTKVHEGERNLIRFICKILLWLFEPTRKEYPGSVSYSFNHKRAFTLEQWSYLLAWLCSNSSGYTSPKAGDIYQGGIPVSLALFLYSPIGVHYGCFWKKRILN